MTAAPASPRTYASEKMATRRDRVVRIARQILAEGGPEALTIARLSEEAQVASSTIYRSFESKEGVILATIVDHMRGIAEYLHRSHRRPGLEGVFAEFDWVAAELFRDPAYARVVIDFYFSGEASPAARRELRSVAQARVTEWLAEVGAGGALTPGLALDRLIETEVDSEYVVLHKWARGLVARERLADELKASFLLSAAVATTGAVREEALAHLAQLHKTLGTPPLKAQLEG